MYLDYKMMIMFRSIMFGFYCITFKKYMLAGKYLLDYGSLFFLRPVKRMTR